MKKNPEMIFLFPNQENGDLDYHLGVNYIIAYLRKKGIYAEQFINDRFLGLNELAERILSKCSKVVGFTCYDTNYFLVKLISQSIKKISPDTLIILGGPTATFSDEAIMNNSSQIDICVRGEGEDTTLEILQQLKSHRDFSKILGLSFRKNSRIIRNPHRPFIEELDSIPSPYLTKIMDPISTFKQNQEISILTSRGCVYHCAYCNFSAMSRYTIRYHSVERIISELKLINERVKNHKATISFMDDTFTLNKERAKAICQRIIEEKINLDFWVETRADYIDEELLDLLSRAGVRKINFGLESAVPKILYNIKKVRTAYGAKDNLKLEREFIRQVRDKVKLTKEKSIHTTVSVIFNLPDETFRDGMKTLNFVKRLKVDMYYHNRLMIFPGTALAEIYKKTRPQEFKKHLLGFYAPGNYNLRMIPKLKNATEIGSKEFKYKENLLAIRRSLMGLYNRTDSRLSLQNIILMNRNAHLKWFKENIPLQTRIFLCAKSSFLPRNPNKIYHLALRFKNYAKDYMIDKYKFCPKTFVKQNKGYLFLLKKLSLLNSSLKNAGGGKNIIFDIADPVDMNGLEKEANTNKDYDYMLMDLCRWANYCPAVKLHRLIIDRHNNILPCPKAKPIGKVGDKLEDLQKKLLILESKEKIKRGCSSCPIENSCAKCLFPGAISPEDYCKFKRKNHRYLSQFRGAIELTSGMMVELLGDKQRK